MRACPAMTRETRLADARQGWCFIFITSLWGTIVCLCLSNLQYFKQLHVYSQYIKNHVTCRSANNSNPAQRLDHSQKSPLPPTATHPDITKNAIRSSNSTIVNITLRDPLLHNRRLFNINPNPTSIAHKSPSRSPRRRPRLPQLRRPILLLGVTSPRHRPPQQRRRHRRAASAARQNEQRARGREPEIGEGSR